jgi:hypothetical protein
MLTTVASRASLDPAQWNDAVDRHQLGWWWHTTHWLDYSLAYTPGAVDESFVLRARSGEILALVPLIIAPDGKLVMGGQTTPAPLLHLMDAEVGEAAEREARRRSGTGHLPLPIQLRPGPPPLGQAPQGISMHSVATYVVDLKASEQDIWKHIRKSYKSLIHKAEKDYHLAVYGASVATWAVECAHRLHVACAGGEMRAPLTWTLMTDWVANGSAVVAIASPSANQSPENQSPQQPVGYAYAIRYKRWAYYASGGSLVNDVQHGLQWELIKALRADGRTAYELGYGAGLRASEKDKGIAHFKAGFGATPLRCVVLAPDSWRPA